MHNNVETIRVQPGEFREAYTSLQGIIPIQKHTYTADPRDGLIRIEYKNCPEMDSEEYFLWKMRYSA